MSNYIKSTNFAVKDGLAVGTAAKRVRGTEIDDEFNAIATASATKANANNAALTGNPTAPTQSAGNNSTRLATTAFTAAAITAAVPTQSTINGYSYPVGSVYTSVDATNPATLLGVGTWESFGAGKVLVGVDTSATPDIDFDTVEEMGGSKTHTLTEAEMPEHDHTNNLRVEANSATMVDTSKFYNAASGNVLDHITSNYTSSTYTGDAGSGDAHNNLQPYITVYFWKRTL
jgi:hypothetical protein